MRSGRPPGTRRLGRGAIILALVALAMLAFGEYRAWQLRTSCTDGGGRWDRDLSQCTFRGGASAAPPTEPSR
jgi:hypothetical protein